jgi:hypothetical protein
MNVVYIRNYRAHQINPMLRFFDTLSKFNIAVYNYGYMGDCFIRFYNE